MSDYAALVIGYKNAGLVAGVLTLLSNQTKLPSRVIVVDNGGTFTETDRAAWPLSDRSVLISRPDNPGYGVAVNLARELVSETALFVLTHDAVFSAELAEQMLAVFEQPAVGAAAPVLHFTNQPSRVFSAGGKLSASGRASHLAAPLSNHPYPVDWLDGAIVMYRVEALDAIDWLDERYFLYFEDVDTSWRLAQAGWKNLIVPGVLASQQPGAHPPYLGMRNMALFARKAGISRFKHLGAVVPRLTRESLSRIRRGKKPELGQALRGLRDGYAGKSGSV